MNPDEGLGIAGIGFEQFKAAVAGYVGDLDAVRGRRKVGKLNIDGDGQADLQGHGGEHRAVLVYQIDSYRYWERQLGRKDFAFGQFGENFTVDGLSDDEVCIGDHYRIGSALFEVTQPRVTCYRVGIRMDEHDLQRTNIEIRSLPEHLRRGLPTAS